MEFIPVYLIFIPILASIVIYLFHNKYLNYLVFVVQILITALTLIFYRSFEVNTTKTLVFGSWSQNIGIALKNDHLSLLFMLLTVLIWWAILIYSWNKRKHDYKFLFFLIFLEGCFFGLIQTNDLFNLFVFIEIITILSTILILYKKDGFSVRAGLYYLLFNSVGMIFFLIGLIFLYNTNGTLNMDLIAQRIVAVRGSDSILFSYVFIMVAVGVKSAFFPVYNWLPKAHSAAPTAISALLSGLLVKSGLYAFIRLNNMYGLTMFSDFFFYLGFFTAISGAIFAICQKDLKQLLAFSTISQIGVILVGLSSFTGTAFVGGVFHIVNHALIKSLLFLGAGVIIKNYSKLKITEIRGVFKTLPVTSSLMIIAMISLTGVPLMNGFISKSLIKYGLQASPYKLAMFHILNLGTAVLLFKLAQIFYGKAVKRKEKSLGDIAPIVLVSLACIALVVFYTPIGQQFFNLNLSFINFFKYSDWITYFITIVLAYLINKFFVAKDFKIIRSIRRINFSFGATNFLLVLFVFIMIVYKFLA